MLVGRYYGAKFVSLNGKAFGENSSVQNEEGMLLSWKSQSVRNTLIEAYADVMYFPWMKQNVSASSYGFEGMLQATFSPSSKWALLARYRINTKQKDFIYNREDGEFTSKLYPIGDKTFGRKGGAARIVFGEDCLTINGVTCKKL